MTSTRSLAEEDAQIRIESIVDAAARERAATGLARLERARKHIAAASRDELGEALDEFDRVFADPVGEAPTRTPELAVRRVLLLNGRGHGSRHAQPT